MSDVERQLDDARRNIVTDSYQMSVGELTNMFRDGGLINRPPFQLGRDHLRSRRQRADSVLVPADGGSHTDVVRSAFSERNVALVVDPNVFAPLVESDLNSFPV